MAGSTTVTSSASNGRAPEGEIHAVIVAGSNGWFNYRHQADACHAYHVLRQHGVPPDNIILMMYDDVANHLTNPYRGKLFNKPDGEDVYKGVKIDYSNFLNVLKGNASGVVGGNGRVLKSKPNDRIFIFYSDHGGVGILAFPIGTLTVKQLNETMFWMYENYRYNQLVFYLEACHSGSMFDQTLTDSINAYAVTAAHRNESSWATYCNTGRLPCLGDEFSVSWMEDSDAVRTLPVTKLYRLLNVYFTSQPLLTPPTLLLNIPDLRNSCTCCVIPI
ncbi:peptidase C13 family protein [Oesophagostomum dentatum]|uniref:legumain n=1 Tax=Oesophagostomum dentatum TaxID=61180 RepID=A0A0B1T8N1_OESDE|nr:peptidase C13 family protein [Oesophagostomum dentatum]